MFNLTGKKMKAALFLFSLGVSVTLSARENIGGSTGGHRNNGNNSVMSGCSAGSTQQEIQLNNVRTRILTDGDMWWDFAASIAKYEIPKGSGSYAQFAGSLWFGGYVNGQIHMSAMTYRQTGIDFWPGPLNPSDLSISVQTCQTYDKVWTFNKNDVANFHAYWLQYGSADPATPTWIKDYPGNPEIPGASVNIPNGTFSTNNNPPLAGLNGTPNPMNYLAPYYDLNTDGRYDYTTGDYPAYIIPAHNILRGQCVRYLFGDQTLFFVFNDNGNSVHGETGGKAIGVEIRGQAFEFSTSDQLNDMSFYNYEIINWSNNIVDTTYFTVWDDCDLGNYQDDYVGCDVSRGLGYQYNGDNYDEDVGGQIGYHDKLPAIGCDFFQGPYANRGDSIDNDRDGCVDCSWLLDATGHPCPTCGPPIMDNALPEQCIMSRFTYYNNIADPEVGNPTGYTQYYNLMAGKWENGNPMTYGNKGTVGTSAPCKFLYPGITDPLGWGLGYKPNGYGANSTVGTPIVQNGYGTTGWTEAQAGNVPADRRFMQSAGPFTLLPGAVNYVTFGIPFARSNSNNNLEPIPLMFAADDKAQALFDNCFKVLDGPDAPDLTIQELNQQLLITLTNNPYTSNNYEGKRYADFDPNIVCASCTTVDNVYRFEGYKVFQLLDGTVSVTDLDNSNLARLVFQCDVKNGVSQLINYTLDPAIGHNVPKIMVSGADAGIQNSFSINQDLFASSDKRLINFKNYYFMAVAYAYNNYLTYAPDVPATASVTTTGTVTSIVYTNPPSGDLNGQKIPYLQGRNNVKLATGIPHNPTVEANGTIMNSSYGNGPAVTRVEGQGNGGYALDLTDQTVNDILNSPVQRAQKLTYVANRAPINVKVIDPLRVVKGDFTVKMVTATSQPAGSTVTWSYDGNPPVASPATLDTGRLRNLPTIKWYMTGTYYDATGNKVTKTWLSDEGLSVAQEKIITGLNNESLGFSVTIKQTSDPQLTARFITAGNYRGSTVAGDLLESSIQYAGTSWLTGVPDMDGNNQPQNWILAGNDAVSSPNDIFGLNSSGTKSSRDFADPGQVWESVIGGTWAPFRMLNTSTHYPGLYPNDLIANSILKDLNPTCDTRLLSSVDVVITSDQSKWTRCPVIDMNPAVDPTTNIMYKWQLRRAPSVDKNGDAISGIYNNDYDSSMSWFPGYAINIETGERLNMIFSENSADVANNGNDMKWNPTSNILDANGNPIFGGKHFIYVLGHNSDGVFTFTSSPTPNTLPADVARYDQGKSVYQMLTGLPSWSRFNPSSSGTNTIQRQNKWGVVAELFKDIMWVSMPLSSVNIQDPRTIPSDVKVKIRVPKPFRYGLSTVTSPANTSYTVNSMFSSPVKTYTNTPLNSNLVANAPYDVLSSPQNGNFPMYTFSTNDLVSSTYQAGTAQAALALINIVPNPYYAHSSYEQTRIDLKVKIINLPVKCTIDIYTLSGTLIRTLNKDNSDTYMAWDLHNNANIQVASGLYVIHINAPGIGERIIKWYGIMRPYDLQSY